MEEYLPENELCGQDYYSLVGDFIKEKSSKIFYRTEFTGKDVESYCLSKTEILDPGDLKKIHHIVYDALQGLMDTDYLEYSNGKYCLKKRFDKGPGIKIEGRIHSTKNRSKEEAKLIAEALDEIEL